MKRIRINTSGIAFLVMTATIVLSPTQGFSWADRTDMSLDIVAEDNNVAEMIENNAEVSIVDEAEISDVCVEEYKESKVEISNVINDISGYKVGDIVKFGHYEQDGNGANGQEEIEWIVLKVESDRVLLISKYALDRKAYNFEYCDVTWETCSLRNWLNNDFKNSAFTPEEQGMIPTVSIANDVNPYYGTTGGNQTEDQIFCLSADEVKEYMGYTKYDDNIQYGYAQALIGEPTQYAVNRGAVAFTITEDEYNGYLKENGYSDDVVGQQSSWWWLRTPGYCNKDACYVSYDGATGLCSDVTVDRASFAVRPALYISVSGTVSEITDENEELNVPPVEDVEADVVPEIDNESKVNDDTTTDIEHIADNFDSDVIYDDNVSDDVIADDQETDANADESEQEIKDEDTVSDTSVDIVESDTIDNDIVADEKDEEIIDTDVVEDTSDSDTLVDVSEPESNGVIVDDNTEDINDEPEDESDDKDVILESDTLDVIIDESAESEPNEDEGL